MLMCFHFALTQYSVAQYFCARQDGEIYSAD